MKNLFLILCMTFVFSLVKGQEHDFAFGFYGDIQLEDTDYDASFGVQGKYEFSNFQGVQAQVHGRGDFVGLGADYILNFLDKEKSNFNIFAGAGFSQEFFTYDFAVNAEGEEPFKGKENYSKAIGQLGISYYFPEVDLSIYTGYKLKYQFKNELLEPNYLIFGVRYHLW